MKKIISTIVLFGICPLLFASNDNCHPKIDESMPQYIIGYGSLMNEQSKRATDPDAGDGMPVWIKGFKRGWFSRAEATGGPTFLGIIAQRNADMNAAIYPIPISAVDKYDQRENTYCRKAVLSDDIRSLTSKTLPQGQMWVYVSSKESIKLADTSYPLVQSYVDIFLSGCLQLEKQFQLHDFAKACIQTTDGWSAYWENDRIFPRRPWQYQPDAVAIDKLLSDNLPALFSQIKQPRFD